MVTPPFFAVQKQSQNGETVIVADNYTLDQVDLDPTTNITIYADVLSVPGKGFLLPAKNITIYARQIDCTAGAGLDTSGAAVTDIIFKPTKADNGSGPGQGGKNGTDSGATPETTARNGGNAGSITIVAQQVTGNLTLKATGGKGQKGQAGQDGGDGISGSAGNDAVIHHAEQHSRRDDWIDPEASPGNRGGNAGNGSNPGKSGNGGTGGNINVKTISALNSGQVTATNDGGDAGDAGDVGHAGNIGNGGPGGRIAVEGTTQDHFHRKYWYLSDDRQGGSENGSTGANGRTDGKVGAKGTNGAYTPASISDPTTILVMNTDMLSLFLLNMRYAEIAYLEGRLEDARKYYQWVISLTSKVQPAAGLATEFLGINSQCRSLIDQISQGLDFYANSMNYVPIVTLAHYVTAVESLLQTGSAIETVYNSYTAYLADQTRAFTGMDSAISMAATVIADYGKSKTDLETQITELVPVIDKLSTALVAQFGVLLQADGAFKAAVQAQRGCSLEGLLNLVKTIINVGQDVMDAWKKPTVKSVKTAATDFEKLFADIQSGKIIQDPNAISGDPQVVADAWHSIYPSGSGDVADDKKLVILQKEFDDAIKPYLSLDAAKDYKKQLHDYIGIAQSRNVKLLAYTNGCVQYLNIIGKINQKQEEANRIKAQIARENVPNLISYRNFLYSMYQDYKSMCLKYLYQENRSYIYWSGTDNAFQIVENSFNGLRLFNSDIQAKIIERINKSTSPDQLLKDVEVIIKPEGREKQFETFRTSRTITFQLGQEDDYFLGWANVLLTKFTISINGVTVDAEPDNKVYAQLIHHGNVIMIDPKDKIYNYSHNQVLSVYQYKISGGQETYVAGGSLGGDDTGGNINRIALSPYATFTINIPDAYNKKVNLDKADKITIHFAGYAVPASKLSKRRALK